MSDKIVSVTDRHPIFIYRDFLESDKLDLYERVVFIYLKMYANKEGQAFPSLATLARVSGMSKRKVQQCIESLKVKGVLKVEHREDEDKGHRSNLYTVYDVKEYWTQGTDKEEKTGGITAEIALKIAELQALGYTVTKKEPTSNGTDQSTIDGDSTELTIPHNKNSKKSKGSQSQDIGTGKQKRSKFAPENERTYDFAELERQILTSQNNKNTKGTDE